MHIPFERTVMGAYRFGSANYLAILGIAWLPFLLFMVAAVLLVVSMLPELNGLMATGPDRWDQAQVSAFVIVILDKTLLMLVLLLLAFAMVTAGLMRRALGQDSEAVFIYFSLGAETWRMFGAYALLLLLAAAFVLAYCFAVVLLSFLLARVSAALQGLATTLLILSGLVLGLYAIVRTQFFLPAVVVAEHHIGIRRSWNLGRGNFWRIVGVVIAVSLPAYVVFTVFYSIVLQLALSSQNPPLVGLTPGKVSPDELRHYFSTWLAATRSVLPVLALLQLLYMVAVTGLSAGAVATAYKLVTGQDGPSDPTRASA